MPAPEKLERLPPKTETSEAVKSLEGSDRVKVRVDVSPALSELSSSLSVMMMVGGVVSAVVVSIVSVSELLGSEPS